MKPATYDEVMKMDSLACRDWLSQLDEYTQDGDCYYHESKEPHTYFPGSRYGDHPIPDTLDAAAACLPEGWFWSKRASANRGGMTSWFAWHTNDDADVPLIEIPDTGDEKVDRFRLAVLARSAEMKGDASCG